MLVFKSASNVSKGVKIRSLYEFAKRRKSVRVRFAPSPTGLLHLGGLRTALYNHLFAKSQNGVSILRIEDTDQSRIVENATEQLIDDLKWCGIVYDEGPYFQSERIELYKKHANQLLEQGDAYYCFCSEMRLKILREEATKTGETQKYDNKCRHLTKEEIDKYLGLGLVPCIRFKMENFVCDFNDFIMGPYSLNQTEGDLVIMKADGFPTYHLANVVDDHYMKISHVLRGVEWLVSTIKHLSIYKALKWDPPCFGHLPLLLNSDGTKLSKRQGDISIKALRQNVMLPNAVVNYIVRFGGGFNFPSDKRYATTYSLEELCERFDISKIRKSSTRISLKDLEDYNRAEISKKLESEEGKNDLVKSVQKMVKDHYKNSLNISEINLEEERIKSILELMSYRLITIESLLSDNFKFIWIWKSDWVIKEVIDNIELIEKLLLEIQSLEWDVVTEKSFLKEFCAKNGLKFSAFMKTLRILFCGNEQGPSIREVMIVLGKKEVLSRLTSVINQKDKQARSQSQ